MAKNTSEFLHQYNTLNAEQKVAVDTIEGPLLVLAGPGTGKTQILTMRIANILLKTDTEPSSILALTFTDSGVRAMKERLISIIGETAYKVNIYTFHSFASDIIQSYPDYFISRGMSEPLSDLERIHVFKNIFDTLKLKELKPFSSPYFYLETVISKIKELKREGVSASYYRSSIAKQNETKDFKQYDINKNLELCDIYENYSKQLLEIKRYDFEDMINFVTEEFENNPEFLSIIQEKYQYILVDEFQDTNSAQSKLLFLLASYWKENANLFVVGDDDQSIYRFQGASTENIKSFIEKYPNAKVVTLAKNYRSSQDILDISSEFINHNKTRISKFLNIPKTLTSATDRNSDSQINFTEFSSSYVESYYICNQVKELVSKSNIKLNDIAIIYRNNYDAMLLTEMLSKIGIKYQVQGGQNLLENGLIIRFLHLLNVIYKIRSKEEDLDLFTLLNYEFMDFDPLDVLKVSRFASEKKKNLFESLDDHELDSLSLKNKDKFEYIKTKLIEWNYSSINTTFIEFTHKLITESGYLKWILNQPDNYRLLNIVNSFIAEIKRLNSTNKELDLETFLNHIAIMNEYHIKINEEELELENDAVHLLTAHKSKGLEYEYVFIPYFIDGKWSNVRTRDLIKFPESLKNEILGRTGNTEYDVSEDERRLLYVTLTRAKKNLYITSSKAYMRDSSKKETIPSMYIQELDKRYIKTLNQSAFEFENNEILRLLLRIPENHLTTTQDEEAFLKHCLRNFKLSATALNTYLECRYKYKLDILLKTPRAKEKQLVLGSAIHDTLKDILKDIVMTDQIELSKCEELFKKNLDKEIVRKSEYKEIYDVGIFILNRYISKNMDYLLSTADNVVSLEKSFGFGFDVPIQDHDILLQGKIDKIELIGKGWLVRIVDYKTGKPKTENEILGKTKNSDGNLYRQLLFYKLLLELLPKNKMKVSKMMLDFIGDRKNEPKQVEFDVPTDDSIDILKSEIRETWDNIHALKFERTTDFTSCHSCKYKDHCWPDGVPKVEAE